MISERRSGAALSRSGEQRRREVETIDEKARLGEQVTVSSLSAGYIENTRFRWKPKHFDDARHLAPIALEREQRLILPQVLGVEIPSPPLGLPRRQKNTGSRYAPNTLSSAARISYSVQ